MGWIKTNEQIPVGVKYTNLRVSYDNKYWYVSVGIEQEEIHEELTNVSLGIDLEIKNLAVCSDTKVYRNINKSHVVRKIEKRLIRLQRQVSRKYEKNKKGKEFVKTKNIIRLEEKIQQMHRKLAIIRTNYLRCGSIKVDLKLSDRIYKCSCGLVTDRDLKASINLANY